MRRITRHPSLLPSHSLTTRSKLPKRPGVYYCIQWWKPWMVLYVGMSGDMNHRWTATGKRHHHKLDPLSTLSGVRIHYRITRTRKMAERLEAIGIMRYKPSLNGRYERLHAKSWVDVADVACDAGLLMSIGFVGAIVLKAFRLI